MIVEYKIVVAANNWLKQDASSIAKLVEAAIREGWQPLGGLCSQEHLLFQAMVKYKE